MEDSDIEEENEMSEEEEEEVLDPDNPEHYFLIVERDFNKTLLEVEKIPEALSLITPFNKLFENFFRTYAKQRLLEHQTEELQNVITEKSQKLDLSMKMAEEEEKTINDLKSQIENAWRMADSAHSRELQAYEVTDNLRRQVEKLNAELDFKNKMNIDDDTDEMAKNRDVLERERDRLINEVTQLNTKLQNAVGYQEELEKKNSEADFKINQIAGLLQDQTQETANEKRIKEDLEIDIMTLNLKIHEKDAHADELKKTINDKQKYIYRLEKEIKELKASRSKDAKELESSMKKLSKMTDEQNNIKFESENVKLQLTERIMDSKACGIELVKMKIELTKVTNVRDILDNRLTNLQREKKDLVLERDSLRLRICMFEKELDDFKKFLIDDRRIIDLTKKEKEMLSRNVQRQQALYIDQLKLFQIHEQSKKKLESDLDLFFLETGKQKKLISQLEREKEKFSGEQLDLNNIIQDQVEDIRQNKAYIFDLEKDGKEKDYKIRHQHNLYEALRSDKNAKVKALQESTSECSDLKKKLKMLSIQLEQLKEEIGVKEKLITKQESIMRSVNKEKEHLKAGLKTTEGTIKKLKSSYKDMLQESKKMQQTLLYQHRSMKNQGLSMNQLVIERDILGAQLVRRNDEVALLTEKINILQATLARGDTHYELRLGDIKLLKLEIKRLRQEKSIISKTMACMVDLRQEIFHLERDLTRSRMKCKALEQEVQNPLNVHRWRKLGGSDPGVLDLLQKIQILQRRLLQQASITVERERQLKQSEKLYLNLRKIVSRQPGPSIQNQLSETFRALKLKEKKLKTLVAELNMADLKQNQYKSDLAKLSDELAELRKKYIAEKKAHKTLRMAYTSSREVNHSGDNESGEVKFTGGGFRMSVSKISTK